MTTNTSKLSVLLTLSLFGCSDVSIDNSTRSAPLEPSQVDQVVYSHSYDEVVIDGKSLREQEHVVGVLDRSTWSYAARPYSKASIQSGYLYEEGSYEHNLGDRVRKHYEVRKTKISESELESALNAPKKPLKWSDNVEQWMQEKAPYNKRKLSLQFRELDDWDVPLSPPENILSPEDYTQALNARRDSISSRKQLTSVKAQDLRDRGFDVLEEDWVSGSVIVETEASTLLNYLQCCSSQLIDIHEEDYNELNACATTGSCLNPYGTPSNAWRLGQNRMGFRTNVDAYHARGWTGERANPARHSWNDIVVTVLDQSFEDESPGFIDYFSVSRIKKKRACSGGSCTTTSNIIESGSTGGHGTTVASIIGADYQDDQAENLIYNDPCYLVSISDPSHCNDWEDVSSGMAPEAGLVLVSAPSLSNNDIASAIGGSIVDQADIYTQSVSSGTVTCDVSSSLIHEDTAENAFDDGILVVNSVTNTGTNSLTTCGLTAPSDTPKIISVNAIANSPAACTSNYSLCGFGDGRRGGADLTFPSGIVRRNVFSGVGLAAPGGVRFHTIAADGTQGDIGSVSQNASGPATSWATPHVAGAAAVIKDGFLAGGHSWINSPGRLATILLAMTDRATGAGTTATSGVNHLFGFGRLKLRTMAEINGGWGMWTKTFTPSSSNYIKNPFGSSPLRTGTDFLKCVMFEAEDMSQKTLVGDRWLRVHKSDPVGGVCPSTPSGINQSSLGVDSSFDLRHMVSSTVDLSGSCVHFEIVHVETVGSLTTNTYCYYGNNNDSWFAP